MPATARRRRQSGAPKRRPSRSAIGRAPIATMSRRMPPTPVAAPWNGSTAVGWLCDSTLNATASPSPRSTTPAFSPGPCSTRSPARGQAAQQGRGVLVAAVLRPEHREHGQLEVVRRAAEQFSMRSNSQSVRPSARWRGCSARRSGGKCTGVRRTGGRSGRVPGGVEARRAAPPRADPAGKPGRCCLAADACPQPRPPRVDSRANSSLRAPDSSTMPSASMANIRSLMPALCTRNAFQCLLSTRLSARAWAVY